MSTVSRAASMAGAALSTSQLPSARSNFGASTAGSDRASELSVGSEDGELLSNSDEEKEAVAAEGTSTALFHEMPTRIPEPFWVVKRSYLRPTEYDARYDVDYRDNQYHITVFPAVHPSAASQVGLLRKALERMVARAQGDQDDDAVTRALAKRDVYRTCFHELTRQVYAVSWPRGELMEKMLADMEENVNVLVEAYESRTVGMDARIKEYDRTALLTEEAAVHHKQELERQRAGLAKEKEYFDELHEQLRQWRQESERLKQDVFDKAQKYQTFKDEAKEWGSVRETLEAQITALRNQLDFERSMLLKEQESAASALHQMKEQLDEYKLKVVGLSSFAQGGGDVFLGRTYRKRNIGTQTGLEGENLFGMYERAARARALAIERKREQRVMQRASANATHLNGSTAVNESTTGTRTNDAGSGSVDGDGSTVGGDGEGGGGSGGGGGGGGDGGGAEDARDDESSSSSEDDLMLFDPPCRFVAILRITEADLPKDREERTRRHGKAPPRTRAWLTHAILAFYFDIIGSAPIGSEELTTPSSFADALWQYLVVTQDSPENARHMGLDMLTAALKYARESSLITSFLSFLADRFPASSFRLYVTMLAHVARTPFGLHFQPSKGEDTAHIHSLHAFQLARTVFREYGLQTVQNAFGRLRRIATEVSDVDLEGLVGATGELEESRAGGLEHSKIEVARFLNACLEEDYQFRRRRIEEVTIFFELLDSDHDGLLTAPQFAALLKRFVPDMPSKELHTLLAQACTHSHSKNGLDCDGVLEACRETQIFEPKFWLPLNVDVSFALDYVEVREAHAVLADAVGALKPLATAVIDQLAEDGDDAVLTRHRTAQLQALVSDTKLFDPDAQDLRPLVMQTVTLAQRFHIAAATNMLHRGMLCVPLLRADLDALTGMLRGRVELWEDLRPKEP